jgi:hypothetical protein
MTRRARLMTMVLAALVSGAVALPSAWAFFMASADQPSTVTADRPSAWVSLDSSPTDPDAGLRDGYAHRADSSAFAASGSDATLAVDLGSVAGTPAFVRAFALRAAGAWPEGGTSVTAVTVDAQGLDTPPFTATLHTTDDQPSDGTIAPGGRLQVDLAPRAGLAAGPHAGVVAVRLAFSDGSFLRVRVPVVFGT